MKLSTAIIHNHNIKDPSGAVMSPLIMATTYERNEDQLSLPQGYIYSRYDHPNKHALENKIRDMEGGADCICFASGLAAATAVFQSLKSGDHVVMADDTYFSMRTIINTLYAGFGLNYTLADFTKLHEVEKAILPATKLIWMESPSNPSIKVTDIAAIVKIAKRHNCITVADNTWATPLYTQPLELDVDIVLHSTTKYIGGHSDVLGGALVFKEYNERSEFIKKVQCYGGATPSAFDCWLLCRSLTTFSARMAIHSANAQKLAHYLEQEPKIEKVMYPGLPSHPQHDIAARQMKGGYGGMLSILVQGGKEKALRLCALLKLFTHATSLGGVESLIEHRKSTESPDSTTPDHLLRISVGIEDIDDLIGDFKQALEKL